MATGKPGGVGGGGAAGEASTVPHPPDPVPYPAGAEPPCDL